MRPVVRVYQNDSGPMGGELGFRVLRVCADDQQISHHRLAGCRTVEADCSVASRSADRVGGEALSVRDVIDLNVLEFHDAGRFKEFFVDCTGALIVQVRLGNAHAMKLGLQEGLEHRI